MTAEDAEAAADVFREAFADADERAGRTADVLEPEQVERLVRGLRRFPETDPDGCWVATEGEALLGFSAAVRRGSLWGLALLFVRPEAQSKRVGHQLIDLALRTAEGAEVGMIMSSEDPRAIRRYAFAGFGLHPAVKATGSVDRAALPGGLRVRDGSWDDLDLVDAVDLGLRGSSRAPDVAFCLEQGDRLIVIDAGGEPGFAVHRGAGPSMLGASSAVAAGELLWAVLAEADREVQTYGWTSAQGWALEVALAARLRIAPTGPLFVRGLDQPPGPWLPNGWYF